MAYTFEAIEQMADNLRGKISGIPSVGIVLGSGLGSLADTVTNPISIAYNDIPGFPQSTVEGHEGRLIFGKIGEKHIVMMAGRFHYYEGYDMATVTLPIRIMKALGVEVLLLSNAAGAINPIFTVGDIMLIRDHINLFPEHPLRGSNDSRFGARFPDMSEPYDKDILKKAHEIGLSQVLLLREGVYIGLQGPTFETRAEYEWLHRIGGDAVGMSTVPETIVAIHCGMRVFAASIITDVGIREDDNIITHEEVLAAANAAAPKLSSLFRQLVTEL